MSNCCDSGCGPKKPVTQREEPSEEDIARFGGDSDGEYDEIANCPACGLAIWEDAPRCRHCGENLVSRGGPSAWVLAVGAAALLGMLWWVL